MATSLAPPRRLGLEEPGDLIVLTWRCLRRRPLAFALLAIVPALLGTLALGLPAALWYAATSGRFNSMTSGLIGVGAVVGGLAGVLLNLRFLALLAAAADAAARGQPIGLTRALRRTSGFFGRSLGLALLGTGVVLLLVAGLAWTVETVGGEAPWVVLIAIALPVLLGWMLIGTRLYPLLPTLALDTERSGFAALAYAWRLTSGQLVRTFSWVALLGSLAWLARVLALLPVALLVAAANPDADIAAQLAAGGFSIVLTGLAVAACGLVSVPFLVIAQTLYCADLVQRRPTVPTLNWAPPTSGPAGGLGGPGWRPSAISQGGSWPTPKQG